MNKPFVSICIPAYNGEKYLKECIDSCIAQTFPNYEIIICDDGSTDKTSQIIASYKSPKIKFFRNDYNLGLVGNWNKCIELSSGDWIKFVFQDDFISHNCLQTFVNEVDINTHLIVSKRNFILPENASSNDVYYYTKEVRTVENTTNYKGKIYPSKLISTIAVQNICMNFIGEPSLIFFRKSIVNEVGLFNHDLKQICDLEFALRIASKYGLKYIPNKLCSFRVHPNSTTSTNIINKYFILHYIEPLLFSYFLLYDEKFQVFRSNLNFFQLIKLKLYFKVKAYRAYTINLKENQNHHVFDEENTPYPKITKNKKGSLLVKLISSILYSK